MVFLSRPSVLGPVSGDRHAHDDSNVLVKRLRYFVARRQSSLTSSRWRQQPSSDLGLEGLCSSSAAQLLDDAVV
jgi:hypothetical protein